MSYVYVLELEHNKYYVGKTDSPITRLTDHFIEENKTAFTSLHKPINIIEIVEGCGKYDEEKYTLLYMEKYGIENVRGGAFCTPTLSRETVEVIRKMIYSANNKCFKCGGDHFAKDCTFPSTKIECKYCNEKFEGEALLEHEKLCRITSFLTSLKIKQTSIPSSSLLTSSLSSSSSSSLPSSFPSIQHRYDPKDFCERCGRVGHLTDRCYARTHFNGSPLQQSPSYSSMSERLKKECERCGRWSHTAKECFAMTHLKGYLLPYSTTERGKEIIKEIEEAQSVGPVRGAMRSPPNADLDVPFPNT